MKNGCPEILLLLQLDNVHWGFYPNSGVITAEFTAPFKKYFTENQENMSINTEELSPFLYKGSMIQ